MLTVRFAASSDGDRTYLVVNGKRVGFVTTATVLQLAQVQDFGPRELAPVDLQTSGKESTMAEVRMDADVSEEAVQLVAEQHDVERGEVLAAALGPARLLVAALEERERAIGAGLPYLNHGNVAEKHLTMLRAHAERLELLRTIRRFANKASFARWQRGRAALLFALTLASVTACAEPAAPVTCQLLGTEWRVGFAVEYWGPEGCVMPPCRPGHYCPPPIRERP